MMPSPTAPTVSATSWRSPVTTTIRSMLLCRKARTVRAASVLIGSSRTTTPAGSPSMGTKTVSMPSSLARRRAALAHVGLPATPAHAASPTATACPSILPRISWSVTFSTASGRASGKSRASVAFTTVLARTCGDSCSWDAAIPDTSSARRLPVTTTAPNLGRPTVSCSPSIEQQGGARRQPLEEATALHDHGERPGTARRPGRPVPSG